MKNLKKYRVSLAVKIPANFEMEVSAKNEKEAFEKVYDSFDGNDEKHITELFWDEVELDIVNKNINKFGNGIDVEKID